MSALLACDQLVLTLGDIPFSLELAQGEIVRVSMSTDRQTSLLLQTILGEQPAAAGEIYLFGYNLAACGHEELLKLRSNLAVVTPQAGLVANLKLWENIMLPLLYHRGSAEVTAADQATQLLDRLGYRGNIWSLPGHLTPAERIITCFIRAAVSRPALVVYAGVLSELTVAQRSSLLQEIATLHGQPASPAALFISVGHEQLEGLQIHRQYDLYHQQSTTARVS